MGMYELILRVEGPVFIGDGKKIGKKEYIFLPDQHQVCVPDMARMFQAFERQRLMDAYQDYLLGDRRDLAAWLRDKRLLAFRQIPPWVAYSLDRGDAVLEERGKWEILTFIKDPYGCPYVPGSSIKGMLRTVLLSAMLLRDQGALRQVQEAVRRADLRGSRARLLGRETAQVEQRYLHTLERPDVPASNKVNDVMSGLRVSDSRPLSTDDLVLCQKIDVTVDGQRKRLPILRECLRPGTEIVCTLSLLPDLPFSAGQLLQAAERCKRAYDRYFASAFPAAGIQRGGTVYLGGGSGYASKTFTYPLLGEDAVGTVSQIIDATLPFKVRGQHGHRADRQKGVSPHMLKCTQYQRKIYEMGGCTLAIKKK